MLFMAAATLGNGSPAIHTLTAATVTGIDADGTWEGTSAGMRINSDGTTDTIKQTDGGALTYAQVQSATDWVIPNGMASGDYDVRITGLTEHANHTGTYAAVEDTWIDLSADRSYYVSSTTGAVDSTTVTIEIRDATGTTVVSSAFTFTTENTS